MKSKRFSVLLSVYSKENPVFLSQSLESVFNQTLFPHEVVVVKDGPLTEDLENVLEKFSDKYSKVLNIVSLDQNQGLGKALCIGVDSCINELVVRMDTDDICLPDRFEKQIDFMQKNPLVDVTSGFVYEFIDSPNCVLNIKKVPEEDKSIKKNHKIRNSMNHMAVAFKKSSIIEIGNYQEMPYFEDYYLWARMMNKGMIFYNIQESLVYARVGNDMIGRRHGISYLIKEYNNFKQLHKIHFISHIEFFRIVFFRLPLRLLPKKVLKLIYKFIRK